MKIDLITLHDPLGGPWKVFDLTLDVRFMVEALYAKDGSSTQGLLPGGLHFRLTNNAEIISHVYSTTEFTSEVHAWALYQKDKLLIRVSSSGPQIVWHPFSTEIDIADITLPMELVVSMYPDPMHSSMQKAKPTRKTLIGKILDRV